MKFLFSVLFTIPAVFCSGYVFSRMWNWFIVRKFNLPDLNFMEAVGVLFVVGYPFLSFTLANVSSELVKEKNMDASTARIVTVLFTVFIVYPVVLGASYLLHLVIG